MKDKKDYEFILDRMESVLGFERVKSFHSHFSKIEYNNKSGEIRHLTFDDNAFGPDFGPLAQLIAERGYTPRIICESAGTQAEDAMSMRDEYLKAKGIKI